MNFHDRITNRIFTVRDKGPAHMQFELRITGNDARELTGVLEHLAGRQAVIEAAAKAVAQANARANGGGLPSTPEAFAVAARASQANAAPAPPSQADPIGLGAAALGPTVTAVLEKLAEPDAPAKARGRPRKDVIGTIIEGPDGTPHAVMTEPEAEAEPEAPVAQDNDVIIPPNFPKIADNPTTPSEMRDKAIALLQSVFGKKQGPAEVRSLQTRFKIKKFNEVPDDMCEVLLRAAHDLHDRVMATS